MKATTQRLVTSIGHDAFFRFDSITLSMCFLLATRAERPFMHMTAQAFSTILLFFRHHHDKRGLSDMAFHILIAVDM